MRRRQWLAAGCGLVAVGAALAWLWSNAGLIEDALLETPEAYPISTAPPYVVALDAGHGGNDSGACSGQVQETLLCEETVDALYRLLAADAFFKPVRTRENGQDSSIQKRVDRAAEQRAAVLLSIHMNSDPSTAQSHGFECFPTPPGRKWSEDSMKLATAIAEQMGQAGHRLRGSSGIRFAYYSGKRKLIVDAEDSRERTLKSFGILENSPCPAVLAEQCFITNSADRAAWTGAEGSEKAADAYYRGLCAYFGLEPYAPRTPPQPTPPPVTESWP